MEKLKVFISGTQDDMQPERRAVAKAVRALKHEPLMAETYGTLPQPSISVIREMIDHADIYMGVYGARYGFQPDGKTSVTEFEFNEFRRKHPDRILIYVKDITLEPEQATFLTRVQDFKEGYFRRQKFRDTSQLAEWVKEDLAQFIARVVHEKMRGGPEPALVKAYLEEVAVQKPYVLWSDQTYIDRTVAKTEDLFTRIVARYDPRTIDREDKAKPEPLEPVLAREGKLVLLGEPGLGKTTSLVHLAWEAANRALSKPPEGSEPSGGSPDEIPIYVELKYYNGETELETLLARRVNEILCARNLMLTPDLTESTRILKAWLAQPDARFLLLLDGLNEVRPEFRIAARGALQALLNYPHRIVISCRERDYDESLRQHAAAFVLQGLQENEIRGYLRERLGTEGRALLHAEIYRDEKMRTLVANPLMLWLVCEVARVDPEERLPANRGRLFCTFVKAMPGLRRKEGVPMPDVPQDVVVAALRALAFEMQEHGPPPPDLGRVRGWGLPTATYRLEDILAVGKAWRFLKSDGSRDEPVEFLHQLFQEYFAADELRARLDHRHDYAAIMGGRPFTSEWDEVVVMLAGIHDDPAGLVKWLGKEVGARQQGRAAQLVKRCWKTSDAASDARARAAVVDALIQALADSDERVRWLAAMSLEEIGDVRAMEPLMRALRDSDEWVYVGAAMALGKMGAPAVEPLIQALGDSDKRIRWEAVLALGRIGDPRALEPLIGALGDPDATVRWRAAEALGEIGDVRVIEPLIGVLGDPDATVRWRVPWVLGKIGDPRAVEPLVQALRDQDVRVRSGAVWALEEIGDARALPELERVAREDAGVSLLGRRVADLAREAAERIREQMAEQNIR